MNSISMDYGSSGSGREPSRGEPVSASGNLLEVDNLSIFFGRGAHPTQVTKNVSFNVRPGERIGIVGESGCGKTVTGLSLLGLLPKALSRTTGNIMFDGLNLSSAPEHQLRKVRGRHIAMIFQEPMSALDPVFTIGQQIGEALRTHFGIGAREARERAIDVLDRVGIPLPARRHDEYPHQLSGGMRQRAMIAIALACEPRLLIADEPTTALDVTIQAQIIDILLRLSEESGTALLFITHDLGVVAETCRRIITMYAGEIVEDARTDDVLLRPRHPYTSGLICSLPRLSARKAKLPSIPGRVPNAFEMPAGCRFEARCAHAEDACRTPQAIASVEPGHLARCRRADELDLPGVLA
jgi:peptide/nickel transport system ATP-binding protein